jgi:hypothetical protein
MQTYDPLTSISNEYDPILVMFQKFDADFLLFDLSDDGRIIASRTAHARLRHGQSFWDLIQTDEKKSLTDYLLSYETMPAVIETSLGIAIVFPTAVSNASLAMALIPLMEKNVLLHALDSLFDGKFFWSEHLRAPRRSEKFTPTKKDLTQIDELLRLFSCSDSSSAEHTLPQSIYYLSMLCGCPVHLLSDASFPVPALWNSQLFEAMLTVALLFCRRASRAREVFLSFEQCSDGVTVELRAPNPMEDAATASEIVWLSSLAERKRIFFECTALDHQLCLRWIPISPDWSYLGLKTSSHLGFMNHAPWSNDEKS